MLNWSTETRITIIMTFFINSRLETCIQSSGVCSSIGTFYNSLCFDIQRHYCWNQCVERQILRVWLSTTKTDTIFFMKFCNSWESSKNQYSFIRRSSVLALPNNFAIGFMEVGSSNKTAIPTRGCRLIWCLWCISFISSIAAFTFSLTSLVICLSFGGRLNPFFK